MNSVSIMMVTYNRLNFTERMLQSFFETTKSPYDLIIVDNGSQDGTPEYLQKISEKKYQHCQSITLKMNSENRGIATGRNQCLKIAGTLKNKYMSTLDNDVEMPIDWLQNCINIIEKNPNYYIGINMEDTSYPLKTINGCTFQYKERGNLGSACMVFDRKLHDKIGFFYGYGLLYATEDADFGMRSRIAGYSMGYLKENGVHFGTNELEDTKYRKWKTACHTLNLAPFQKRCRDYANGSVPIFYPYSE
jgi:GT2 family glycosyltransferase